MGQRSHELNEVGAPAAEDPPRRIEREIESLRDELDDLVDELERRRHDAFDVRVQLRRHPWPIALGAGALVAGIALAARRRRSPRTLAEQVGAVLRGAYALGEHPERIERAAEVSPALGAQLARTAALAAASVLAQRLARRVLGGPS